VDHAMRLKQFSRNFATPQKRFSGLILHFGRLIEEQAA
jgi:hypothetical protein